MACGRARSKFSATIRSVPPAIGTASGCAAFMASACSQVSGARISTGSSMMHGCRPHVASGGCRTRSSPRPTTTRAACRRSATRPWSSSSRRAWRPSRIGQYLVSLPAGDGTVRAGRAGLRDLPLRRWRARRAVLSGGDALALHAGGFVYLPGDDAYDIAAGDQPGAAADRQAPLRAASRTSTRPARAVGPPRRRALRRHRRARLPPPRAAAHRPTRPSTST